jgi:D-alanyl-D-alanine carboxypeptidase
LSDKGSSTDIEKQSPDATSETPDKSVAPASSNGSESKPSAEPPLPPTGEPTPSKQPDSPSIPVVADPDSIAVVVNKQSALPKSYVPADLVFPKVPFLSSATTEKRKMRKEAATALEQLFAAAKKDGILLAGVSAYRSYQTQKELFEYYAKRDGEEKARTYSAVQGTSEHETGLAIDVSGLNGKCPATDCFANTPEAKWLAEHAHEYGFIIRYPQGKQSITGYQYEPWHLRYVGIAIAQEIHAKGITLEEYSAALLVEKKVETTPKTRP